MPARRRVKKTVDWTGLVQVAVILTVTTGLWLLYKTNQANTQEWDRVTDWLHQHGLDNCQDKLYSAGRVLYDYVTFFLAIKVKE